MYKFPIILIDAINWNEKQFSLFLENNKLVIENNHSVITLRKYVVFLIRASQNAILIKYQNQLPILEIDNQIQKTTFDNVDSSKINLINLNNVELKKYQDLYKQEKFYFEYYLDDNFEILIKQVKTDKLFFSEPKRNNFLLKLSNQNQLNSEIEQFFDGIILTDNNFIIKKT